MTRSLASLTFVIVLSLSACSRPDTERVDQSAPLQRASDDADRYINDVVTAPTAGAEADAIRKLRQWEIDNKLTYTIKAFNTFDNTPIEDPSTATGTVRVEIAIFRGREAIRTFVFQPKDNRNLVLFGE